MGEIAKISHEDIDSQGVNGEATSEAIGSTNGSTNGITNGITNGESSRSNTQNQSKSNEIRRELSTTFCSIAELFMTDLCDEETAEEQCKSSINKAIEADPSNPEAYQQMASFLLVKQEPEEAKK